MFLSLFRELRVSSLSLRKGDPIERLSAPRTSSQAGRSVGALQGPHLSGTHLGLQRSETWSLGCRCLGITESKDENQNRKGRIHGDERLPVLPRARVDSVFLGPDMMGWMALPEEPRMAHARRPYFPGTAFGVSA